jgi:hypothetical protein
MKRKYCASALELDRLASAQDDVLSVEVVGGRLDSSLKWIVREKNQPTLTFQPYLGKFVIDLR